MVKKLSRTLGSLVHNLSPDLLSRPTHLLSSLPPRGLALGLVAAAALAAGIALYPHTGSPRQVVAPTPSPSALVADLAMREELARPGYLVNRGGTPLTGPPLTAAPPTAAPQISSRGGTRPTAIPPQPTPTSIPTEAFSYQVAEGDTVASLAERFGISAETLVWANDLAGSGAMLQAGQELTILPVSGVLHTVQQGETLNGIAAAYGVDAGMIVEANALENSDALSIDQDLMIPGGRPLPSPTPQPTAPPPTPTEAAPVATPPEATLEIATPAPEPSDKGAEIAAIAAQYLGCPYVYGGTSPSGFDCSGFVQYVYAQAGITIPRTSVQQATAGAAVSRDALLPGDILVFQGTYAAGISHVGIYVGDGRMINASNPTRGVCYDAIDGAYWVEHYYGARRPW